METRFVCTYTPTVKKIAEATRKLYPVRVIIQILVGVLVFAYMAIRAWEFGFEGVWKICFAVGVIYLVWSLTIPEINAYFFIRRRKKAMGSHPVREIAFGDSIEISEKTVKVIWEYSDIQKVKRLKNTYILMKDKNMGFTIDPDSFTVGNFYNFKQFLRGKCPNVQIPE